MLRKQTLGNFTNGNLILCNFTWVHLPCINIPKVFFLWLWYKQEYNCFCNDYYYFEFNSDSCVKVKIKIYPIPKKLYKGMPMIPVSNSRSASVMCHMSCVTCQVSRIMCHVSPVTCNLSCVTCHLSCVSPVTCHMTKYLFLHFLIKKKHL